MPSLLNWYVNSLTVTLQTLTTSRRQDFPDLGTKNTAMDKTQIPTLKGAYIPGDVKWGTSNEPIIQYVRKCWCQGERESKGG